MPLREKKLPVVLSVEEVQRLLACVSLPRYRVCLSVLYSCGLRLQEGTHLRVSQIDTGAHWARMMLHIQAGKGNKDRYVPLPQATLDLLRSYWATHRHPVWIFPAIIPAGWTPPHDQPMDGSGVQKAFKSALQCSGIQKPAIIPAVTGIVPSVNTRPPKIGWNDNASCSCPCRTFS